MSILSRIMSDEPAVHAPAGRRPLPLAVVIALLAAPVIALVLLFTIPGVWSVIAAVGTIGLSLLLLVPYLRERWMKVSIGLLATGYLGVVIGVAVLERAA